MKCNKISCTLALGIILVLLLVAFPANPTRAMAGVIELYPNEGKISDWIGISGRGFNANEVVRIYFSSDEANIGDYIDDEVTAYKHVLYITSTSADGDFDALFFIVPDKLTDGKDEEDVHGGDYYVYATYILGKKRIEAVAKFIVIGGEIELDPKEGQVGTEVEISGEGLRNSQKITIEYDGDDVDIAHGDEQTDSDGKFTCTIIIPESTADNHIITVIDESGNKPEAEFSVKPKITITPTSASVGETIKVSGTGFAGREYITITFDGHTVFTNPLPIKAKRNGSFSGSFLVPYDAISGTSKVVAADNSYNVAKAELTIFILAIPATPAGISLRPTTSLTSPGHVGMELIVDGTSFIANTPVTITYGNGKAITVATATPDADGNFSATFIIPPSVAGSHTVTAIDGTNTVTSVFTMESETPPMPTPLLPEVATTTEAKAYFDWTDVEDLSGVTYTLQITSDKDFTTIVLEKKSLTNSEYTITEGEKLKPTEKEAPYYWRVKAIDSAFNESEWTPSGLFYVGFSWGSIPDWVQYTFYGLGGLLLAILGFWVRRRTTSY
jgi:hypothetical protein